MKYGAEKRHQGRPLISKRPGQIQWRAANDLAKYYQELGDKPGNVTEEELLDDVLYEAWCQRVSPLISQGEVVYIGGNLQIRN